MHSRIRSGDADAVDLDFVLHAMKREERERACERALFNARACVIAHLRKNWRGRGAVAAFNDEQARRWMRYAASSTNAGTRRAALALQA